LYLLSLRRRPPSTLFPYTTLFRSADVSEQLRDAEVEQLGIDAAVRIAREEDVLRLEIAVRDALCVRGVERAPDRTQDRQRLGDRSEEHTSELQSPCNLVCRLLLEK